MYPKKYHKNRLTLNFTYKVHITKNERLPEAQQKANHVKLKPNKAYISFIFVFSFPFQKISLFQLLL